MRKLSLLLLALLCVSGLFAQKLSPDGPYLLFSNDSYQYIAVDTAGNIINKTINKKFKKETIEVFSDDKSIHFEVNVSKKVKPTPTYQEFDGKIAVLTDPHGDITSFVTTLQNNKIIDKKLKWSFGQNQLVIIGDIFDRGVDATTILWLTYKLEQEAAKSGGRVNYIVGNHEDMILKGDDRYMEDKYQQLVDTLAIEHKSLYAKNTFFGDWIRSKNIIQVIDNNIFVHAGLGEEFYERDLKLDYINSTVPRWLGTSTSQKEEIGGDIEFIYRTYGPIWYRGMAYDKEKYKPVSDKTVKKILRRYNADRVILGHTIFDDITTRYDGKVIQANVKNDKNRTAGKGMGILIIDNKIYKMYTSKKAERIKL